MTLRLAHRGDWRVGPENGLRALLAGATAPRSDGVEFDVLLAADGTPVVIHDADLRRVQGVDAAVAELTAAELAPYEVPALVTVLDALPSEAFLDVELKVRPNAEWRGCWSVREARSRSGRSSPRSSPGPCGPWRTWLPAGRAGSTSLR